MKETFLQNKSRILLGFILIISILYYLLVPNYSQLVEFNTWRFYLAPLSHLAINIFGSALLIFIFIKALKPWVWISIPYTLLAYGAVFTGPGQSNWSPFGPAAAPAVGRYYLILTAIIIVVTYFFIWLKNNKLTK